MGARKRKKKAEPEPLRIFGYDALPIVLILLMAGFMSGGVGIAYVFWTSPEPSEAPKVVVEAPLEEEERTTPDGVPIHRGVQGGTMRDADAEPLPVNDPPPE